MDNKVITFLYEITPQEEIFCQYYLLTCNLTESAYHAHMLDLKNKVEYDKLDLKQQKNLNTMARRAIEKNKVKERISFLAKEAAEKNSCASLEEIMGFLTTIIRKSKENGYKNIMLLNSAIKAVETLIKRYPNFEGSAQQEKIVFNRGVKNGSSN